MQEMLKDSGLEQNIPGISFKYVPDASELAGCFAFGLQFARGLK
jgi:flavorubredoxin